MTSSLPPSSSAFVLVSFVVCLNESGSNPWSLAPQLSCPEDTSVWMASGSWKSCTSHTEVTSAPLHVFPWVFFPIEWYLHPPGCRHQTCQLLPRVLLPQFCNTPYTSPFYNTSNLFFGSILLSLLQTLFQVLIDLVVYTLTAVPQLGGSRWGGGEDGKGVLSGIQSDCVTPSLSPLMPYSLAWQGSSSWRGPCLLSNLIFCCFPWTCDVTAIHRFWPCLMHWPILLRSVS